MMKKWFSPHPYLIGLFPILFLFASNAEQVRLHELVAPCAIVLLFTAVASVGLNTLTRNIHKSSLCLSIFLLLFLTHGHVRNAVVGLDTGMRAIERYPDGTVFWSLCFFGALAVFFIQRSRVCLARLSSVVTTVASILVAIQIVTGGWVVIARNSIEIDRRAIEASGASGPQPNIYYIVVDAYARHDVLREIFDYDNADFLTYLEDRGFYVAAESRSNYAQTLQSLTSTLNMDYIQELGDFDPSISDRVPLATLFQNAQLFTFLRDSGYQIVQLASGYTFTELQQPDVQLGPQHSRSEFHNLVLSTTPFSFLARKWVSQYKLARSNILYSFAELPRIKDLERVKPPFFAFAYIVCPHPPFLFKADGEETQPDRPFRRSDGSHFIRDGGSSDEYLQGYREQVAFVTARLHRTVEEILAKDTKSPVIIVQSDHGSGARLNWDSLEETDLWERMSILNAYYLPGLDTSDLYPSISPVNTFRLVLNTYFGTKLNMLQDKTFFSLWGQPTCTILWAPPRAPKAPVPTLNRPSPTEYSTTKYFGLFADSSLTRISDLVVVPYR